MHCAANWFPGPRSAVGGRDGDGIKIQPQPVLLSPWPMSRPRGWVEGVNQPLTENELTAVRDAVRCGGPFGDGEWMESTVKRLGLYSTMCPRGRPRVRNFLPNHGRKLTQAAGLG